MVFITEVESVYCEVRTESLYNTDTFRPSRLQFKSLWHWNRRCSGKVHLCVELNDHLTGGLDTEVLIVLWFNSRWFWFIWPNLNCNERTCWIHNSSQNSTECSYFCLVKWLKESEAMVNMCVRYNATEIWHNSIIV